MLIGINQVLIRFSDHWTWRCSSHPPSTWHRRAMNLVPGWRTTISRACSNRARRESSAACFLSGRPRPAASGRFRRRKRGSILGLSQICWRVQHAEFSDSPRSTCLLGGHTFLWAPPASGSAKTPNKKNLRFILRSKGSPCCPRFNAQARSLRRSRR